MGKYVELTALDTGAEKSTVSTYGTQMMGSLL